MASISARSSGDVGDYVTITGAGFNASDTITISFDGITVDTETSDLTGAFSGSFNVPNDAYGLYVAGLEADDTVGGSATQDFTIAPAYTLEVTTVGEVELDPTDGSPMPWAVYHSSLPNSTPPSQDGTTGLVTVTNDYSGSAPASTFTETSPTGKGDSTQPAKKYLGGANTWEQ